ncbi:MAG: class I SAM-dependent methyltransferase [Saprospiraceae bacterium]|nr:class I SAM-dependent methyltransferase [Saprospiraceae bacterium]
MEGFDEFANRLGKMARHYDKWARRQSITCYRVYDGDILRFPLAIDRYEHWVHISEYQRDNEMDEQEYHLWRSGCRQVISEVLDVPLQHLYFKERMQQKGSSQYQKQSASGRERTVQENGLKFLVNLEDYLDTGLFLDHRQTRAIVRNLSAGKKVLNLFAYTGSFTVYAAAGGARETLTLDLSNTYLDWAHRNLALNNLTGEEHRFERVDVLEWLSGKPRGLYDIIILDPPTFSNSKMMRDILDLQRDHPGLIEACVMRLSEEGLLLFSTNHRRFRLQEDRLPPWINVRNISSLTVPPDFRNKKIHQCWVLGRGDLNPIHALGFNKK